MSVTPKVRLVAEGVVEIHDADSADVAEALAARIFAVLFGRVAGELVEIERQGPGEYLARRLP